MILEAIGDDKSPKLSKMRARPGWRTSKGVSRYAKMDPEEGRLALGRATTPPHSLEARPLHPEAEPLGPGVSDPIDELRGKISDDSLRVLRRLSELFVRAHADTWRTAPSTHFVRDAVELDRVNHSAIFNTYVGGERGSGSVPSEDKIYGLYRELWQFYPELDRDLTDVGYIISDILTNLLDNAHSPTPVEPTAHQAAPPRSARPGRPTKETLESLYDEHGSWAAVADHLGRQPSTVKKWARKYGIEMGLGPSPRERGVSGTFPSKEELEALYDVHGTWSAVARHFGVPLVSVTRWRDRAGIEKGKYSRYHTGPTPSKEELESLYIMLGSSWPAVGEHFNVSGATANRWARKHGIIGAPKSYRPSTFTGPAPSKEELEALYDEHGTWGAVADHLDVAGPTVSKWARKHGIEKGRNRPRSRARGDIPTKEELEALYDVHGTWKAVAKFLDVSTVTATRWARKYGSTKGRYRPRAASGHDIQKSRQTDDGPRFSAADFGHVKINEVRLTRGQLRGMIMREIKY